MAIKNEMSVKTKEGEMKVCIMDITPGKANELLCLNTNNRNMRRSRVDLYTKDMINGNWKANGMPIVIGSDGELKDGQHRLQACVKSKKTLKNTLVVYLPKNQANCFDIGATRNTKDIAMFSGMSDAPIYRSFNIYAAVNNAVNGAKNVASCSKLEILNKIQAHTDACEFILYNIIHKKGAQSTRLIKSAITAAVFNAFLNGYDLTKLENFCNVFTSGIAKEDQDVVIIKLRDLTISMADSSREVRHDLYLKAQYALKCYEDNQIVNYLGKNKIEYYPYPDRQSEEDVQLSLEV